MNAKRWALVALGVGLVVWGLDALVRTKAQGYGRPVFHNDAARPVAKAEDVTVTEDADGLRVSVVPGGRVPAPWERLGWTEGAFNPGGHVHASWEQAFVGVGWTEDAYRRLMTHYGAQVQPPTAQLRPEDFTP